MSSPRLAETEPKPTWLTLGKIPESILNWADFIIRDYHDSVLLGKSDDLT
jgi:hypothetical protein